MARLAAIVLAAGASSRFGAENKLLAPIGGRPLVRAVADAVHAAEIADLVVVTGCDAPQIAAALHGLPVRLVANASWETGMGSSIAAGVRALGASVDGALIVPGDMPFLTTGLLRGLVSAFERSQLQAIVYPATPDGAQRNPVLWPQRFFDVLGELSGLEGGKPLLQRRAAEAVAVTIDEGESLLDVDTPADLDAARRRAG
jgi:molybdenum cofactor cytidylyltransferase